MTDQAELTQRILQNIQQSIADLDRKVTGLDRRMEDGFLNLNVRMTAIEGKIDAISLSQTAQSDRLDNLERRVQQLERRFEVTE